MAWWPLLLLRASAAVFATELVHHSSCHALLQLLQSLLHACMKGKAPETRLKSRCTADWHCVAPLKSC